MIIDISQCQNHHIDLVQCDGCGGKGCRICDGKGCLTPKSHPSGRFCHYEYCKKPLHLSRKGFYCSDECTLLAREEHRARLMKKLSEIYHVGAFTEAGLAIVRERGENGKQFHVLEDGTAAYPERYDCIVPFHQGLAAVQKNGKWSCMLPDGTPAFSGEYDEPFMFYRGRAEVSQGGRKFFINLDGMPV